MFSTAVSIFAKFSALFVPSSRFHSSLSSSADASGRATFLDAIASKNRTVHVEGWTSANRGFSGDVRPTPANSGFSEDVAFVSTKACATPTTSSKSWTATGTASAANDNASLAAAVVAKMLPKF